jgi:energy-coupling factor transporter transmembrane protein EcfT
MLVHYYWSLLLLLFFFFLVIIIFASAPSPIAFSDHHKIISPLSPYTYSVLPFIIIVSISSSGLRGLFLLFSFSFCLFVILFWIYLLFFKTALFLKTVDHWYNPPTSSDPQSPCGFRTPHLRQAVQHQQSYNQHLLPPLQQATNNLSL